MFTFIVVRGWAHRLLENGTVESAKIVEEQTDDGNLILVYPNSWQSHKAEDMGLDGWDFDQVRVELDTLRSKLPSGYSVPPQPTKEVVKDKIGQPV